MYGKRNILSLIKSYTGVKNNYHFYRFPAGGVRVQIRFNKLKKNTFGT